MLQKGHNSGKYCRKITIIEHELDIHKIHLQTTPSFNLTFRSHVIIRKPNILQIQSTKGGRTLVKLSKNRHYRT